MSASTDRVLFLPESVMQLVEHCKAVGSHSILIMPTHKHEQGYEGVLHTPGARNRVDPSAVVRCTTLVEGLGGYWAAQLRCMLSQHDESDRCRATHICISGRTRSRSVDRERESWEI